jgi:hypothetical protein
MSTFKFGVIGDPGAFRVDGTDFYYNPKGNGGGTYGYVNSGPAQAAVTEALLEKQVTDLFHTGDSAYYSGSSSLLDASNGQYYNNYMAPYPSPIWLNQPYRDEQGDTVWPYDIYDFPNGFPNPIDGGPGGSADGINRFWPTPGNHDYGGRIAYNEINVTEGNKVNPPVGLSSTAVPTPYVEYFAWLTDPSLVDQNNINVGMADGTGQSGIYYSTTLGEQDNGDPLIELFSIDTQRLLMNVGGYYDLSNGFGTGDKQSAPYNYAYDPTKPYVQGTDTAAVLTNDPDNGQVQFEWLQQGLESSSAKWKIIMGHHPVYSTGGWGQTQPNNHISNPTIQKLLDALPEDSFDAYFNGHAHYYQRAMEGNDQGIGQGIPFVTLGNSGVALQSINESAYGDSIYDTSTPGMTQEIFMGSNSKSGSIADYLLPSDPFTAGVSGMYSVTDNGLYTGKQTGWTAGEYGFGYGFQHTEVDDEFMFFKYEQTDVLDPAITENLDEVTRNTALDGWDGLTLEDWSPAISDDMTSNEISAVMARFGITVAQDGTVAAATVLNAGSGYMSSTGGDYTVDFEVRGNNDAVLDDTSANPNRYAIVTLTFTDGSLSDAVVKDAGEGYTFAAQAFRGNNEPLPAEGVQNIPVTLSASLLEGWWSLPYTPYNDWYMVTDTRIDATATQNGIFGGLAVDINVASDRALEILGTEELPTGYSGLDQQKALLKPQQGIVNVSDAVGSLLSSAGMIMDGSAALEFDRLPAPGLINISFSGDPSSSYVVNFEGSDAGIFVDYGSWNTAGLELGDELISFSQDSLVGLSANRIDTQSGVYSFGLMNTNTLDELTLLSQAEGSSVGALTTEKIFTPSGTNSWLSSEGQALGSIAGQSIALTAGDYTPVAFDANGNVLMANSIVSSGSTFEATFDGGVEAVYTVQGTGAAANLFGGAIEVEVKRLGINENGLAFYEADPLTGAIVTSTGDILLPGDAGYIQQALALAKSADLVLAADDLPEYGAQATLTGLNFDPNANYGLLILHNGSEQTISSSYAEANANADVQMQAFAAPNRGAVWGIEDIMVSDTASDRDYNDLIVSINSSNFVVM